MRAHNGHPEPYDVKYWQVGNEVYGNEYEDRLPDFCRAMKSVDPSIKLLSSHPTGGVLDVAGEYLDYVSPHLHFAEDLSRIDTEVRDYRRLVQQHAPGRGIKLAITEWNGRNPGWGVGRAWLWTLDNAIQCARFHNYMHRHCDFIEIAIRSNLSASFCGGAIQTNNTGLFLTPVYHAQALYGNHQGCYPLSVEPRTAIADEGIDVSATLHRNHQDLTLFVVNDSLQPSYQAIDISGLGTPCRKVQVWTLGDTQQSNSRDVANSFAEPQRVVPLLTEGVAEGTAFRHTFAPLTVTALKLRLRERMDGNVENTTFEVKNLEN